MPKIQTDFVVSGEKQYKQAISEINSGLGVLASEMKKVTAQYQDNAGSVEALTAKGDVLERQLLSQRDKVEKLREALAHAVEKYGEGSKQAMEWEKSLNNAEAAVANTERAIRENNEALEKAKNGMSATGETSDKLSSKIMDLASQFGIKLPGGLDKAVSGMQGFSSGSVKAIAAVTAAVGALVKMYEKMIDMTMESAARADDILTLSQITGLNTDTIQEMQYAAEFIDVSFETIKGSLTKLKSNMQDARDGNEKLQESFRALHVEVTNADGSLRDAESVFYDVIDALGGIENQTERDTMAMDIFGKKAEDLNPLINQSSDRLRELGEEAHNVNTVMSGETLQALGEVDDAYQKLQQTQEGLRDEMAGQLAPGVKELHEVWANFVKEGGELLINSGIVKGMGELLQSVSGLLDPFTDLIDLATPAKGQFSLLYEVLHGIAVTIAWIADSAEAAIGFLTWFLDGGDRYRTAMGRNAQYGKYSHMQAVDGTKDAWEKWNDSFVDWNDQPGPSGTGWTQDDYSRYSWDEDSQRWWDSKEHTWIGGNSTGNMHFVGGRTVVGENGPEQVDLPEGTRIWNAQDTRMGAGGGVTINGDVILEASHVEDLVDAARFLAGLRVARRMM